MLRWTHSGMTGLAPDNRRGDGRKGLHGEETMKKRSRLLFGLALVGLAAIVAAPAALAQDEVEAASQDVIEEILVTATRRGATRLQTTPIAVTAVSGADIERMAPRDLGDIAFMVPNFTNGQTAGFNSASYGIRGVGQTDIIVYLDSPVGITIDDFVVPHIQSQNLEMFDIEAVEVLRGPQGTLFGKNTTGGVVNVRTKRPVLGETSAEARIKYGSFDTKETKFAVNFSAGDQFAVRFAGMYLKSDGFYQNNASFDVFNGGFNTGQGDGRDLGGDDVFSGRAKVLWQPNENFSALLQYEIVRDNADSPPVFNDSPPAAIFANIGFGPEPGDPIKQAGIADRPGFFVDNATGHQVDIDGVYANLEWNAGNYTISSNTGFRHQESRLPSTYTGEVFASLFDATRDDDRSTFQQEVRVSTNLDAPLNFVAGAFFQDNDTKFCVAQVLGISDLFGVPASAIGADPLDPADDVVLAGGWNNNPQVMCSRQDARAFAGFVDGTYEVTDRLSISAGFRYTWEKKKWTGRHQVFTQDLGGSTDTSFTWEQLGTPLAAADFERFPFGVHVNQRKWNEPTYRATVDFDASDNLFTYFTYSHGFRSGNYNDQAGTGGVPFTVTAEITGQTIDQFLAPTDPEFANSFELGLKGSSADGSFRYSIAGFIVDYKNAQRSGVRTITNAQGGTFQETLFFNAAKLDVKGLELEASWIPTPGLMFRGNIGYLDGKYKVFQIDFENDGVIDLDLSDRPITKAPKWQFGFDVIYNHSLGALGSLEFHGSVFYEDDSIYNYSDLGAAFDTVLNRKTLLNANITYSDEDQRYFIRFIGKNLTDKRYKTGSLPVANLWVMTSFGQPRFLGVELGFAFGM